MLLVITAVKKLTAFYEIRRFVVLFAKAYHWTQSSTKPVISTP